MHEIQEKGKLLENGMLREAGYAKHLILDYDRKDIKASRFRIKEWDYYLITNDKFAVALTIADNSYMGLDSISLLNFEGSPWEHTTSPMQFMTMGKKNLPPTSKEGDVKTGNKKYHISFEIKDGKRELDFYMDNFNQGKSIEGHITLDMFDDESMVIATPYKEDKYAFYYNQKINCMPAEGRVLYDGKEYIFNKTDSFAVLDWGRGVWTYKNTWYWSSASGLVDGKRFGFNLGYGFGDTSKATENMLFYQGKAHKLAEIQFNIPEKDGKPDYLSPWTFTSSDGRFTMDFTPIIDRASLTDVKLICSLQHQVFGKFSGKATLDDGTTIEIKDFLGFAEKVFNKW